MNPERLTKHIASLKDEFVTIDVAGSKYRVFGKSIAEHPDGSGLWHAKTRSNDGAEGEQFITFDPVSLRTIASKAN